MAEPCSPEHKPPVVVHELTYTKRFGDPLATYLATLLPEQCKDLRACPELQKSTPVQHIWYRARPEGFWNLASLAPALEGNVPPYRQPPRRHGSAVLDDGDCDDPDERRGLWRPYSILWHDELFFSLAFHILCTLRAEAKEREAEGQGFRDNELVVVVGCTLRRMLGPFQYLMDQLLGDSDLRGCLGLEGVKPCHVQCRVPGELTGPSAQYAYVLRHPRYRDAEPRMWQKSDLQCTGTQAQPMLNYVMMSRPHRRLTVLLHAVDENVDDSRETQNFRGIESECNVERHTLDLNQDGPWWTNSPGGPHGPVFLKRLSTLCAAVGIPTQRP